MTASAIKVTRVKKTFDDCIAVNSLSFEVAPAACMGLLGPNGAALRDNPRPGQVNIFGYDPVSNELEIKFLSGIFPRKTTWMRY